MVEEDAENDPDEEDDDEAWTMWLPSPQMHENFLKRAARKNAAVQADPRRCPSIEVCFAFIA